MARWREHHEENRENVDHINYTLSFLKDNFEETEELEKLIDAISYLNFNFINDFDIHVIEYQDLGIFRVQKNKIIELLKNPLITLNDNKEKILDWKVRNSNCHYINSLNRNFLFNFKIAKS